jgi:thioredoxin 1
MKPVTDMTLVDIVAKATNPIVIKFEAKWCQPCKAMTPLLLDVEKELAGKVDFYVANVEECMMITQRYKINQIPALITIENNLVTSKRTGAASKAEILQWIRTAIPSLKETK